MDLKMQREELDRELRFAAEDRFYDDHNSTKLLMVEKAACEALEAFDAAHPEIITEIRAERAAKIKREYEETAAARGTD